MFYSQTVPDLSRDPVVVLVFTLSGCGHCREYLPRFQRIAAKYEHCLPVIVLDASRAQFSRPADYFRIIGTPATIVLRRGRGVVHKIDGAASDAEIERAFQVAVAGLSCELAQAQRRR